MSDIQVSFGKRVRSLREAMGMRPKPWKMFDDGTNYWNTVEEFEAGIARSRSFRANSLVREHLEDMTGSDRRALYQELKKRLDSA